jgi:hypothetical protein
MGNVTTIGFDIAKSVFQVHGVDAAGAVVLCQRLTRSRMLKLMPSADLVPNQFRALEVRGANGVV